VFLAALFLCVINFSTPRSITFIIAEDFRGGFRVLSETEWCIFRRDLKVQVDGPEAWCSCTANFWKFSRWSVKYADGRDIEIYSFDEITNHDQVYLFRNFKTNFKTELAFFIGTYSEYSEYRLAR